MSPRKSDKARREELAASDPVMAALIERLGPINLSARMRRRGEDRPPAPFESLLRSITGQQISTKAAGAIYARVLDLFDGPPTPAAMVELAEDDLRGAGFSRRKAEYAHDLARHILDGSLEIERLGRLSDEEVIAQISAVRGLGKWSAEIFLLAQLGRPDVIVAGDLGIRRAVMVEYGLAEMPTAAEVEERAEAWRPERSLASIYLWESAHVPVR